jgi:2-polyprenyl-6-methoxyphenol hydroxylase-like FAD-dependent oxidoreductase
MSALSLVLSSIVRATAFLQGFPHHTERVLVLAIRPVKQRDADMPQRRALIVGGSMSGLLAAIMLERRGWQVDVFERAETELAGRGAGIVAQPELIGRLGALGLDGFGEGGRDPGVAVSARRILGKDGSVTLTAIRPQVLTAWELVYRALRDAFPAANYHRGHGLNAVEPRDDGVVAHFTGGRTVEADVLIGADGLRSTVRQQYLPAVVPLYAGYVAWRALLSEAALPPAVHREVFEAMTFCLPPGEQFLGYPVAGPDNDLRPGHRRYNIVWYRPAEETTELARLLTDDRGVTHSISIPPPLIRGEAIAAMRDAAERLLAPQLRAMVRLIDEPILQPIYDLASPRLAFGRVAIIGDAAFVARPHVAAGVSKAADDAAVLAAALDSGGVEDALRTYEAARLADGHRIVERARLLGAYLQATQNEQERESSVRHSIPEAVLAETALIDFLYT